MSTHNEQALPLVSIITVVYNNRAELAVTMDSISAQTYPNVEYIIVDGGSTDGTVELIKQRADEVSRWVSEPDKGLYDAMNKGQQMATGDFVWFMNSGDLINSPDTLNDIFKAHGLKDDAYYGETYLIDEAGEILGTRSQLSTRKIPAALSWKSFRKGNVISHQSLIVRRSIAATYNLKYPAAADIDWEITSLKQAKSVVNTGGVVSRFLVGGFSNSHKVSSWQERWAIMQRHYGLLQTVAYHIYFVFRAAAFKLFGAKL